MHTHHEHHHHGDDLADLLDLDAEVLGEFHAGIVAWVGEHAGDPERIVDLGAGTGSGTVRLLTRFPAATAVAVDGSPQMLHRLAGHAARRGLADRVRTVAADLDNGWPAEAGPADLVWAANSMHHMADPVAVLRAAKGALRGGGVFALFELDTFPSFLPEDQGVGRPGLERRLAGIMARRRAADMPHLGGDWPATLAAAGLEIRAERRFTAELTAPPAAAGRYAHASFARTRQGLADDLDAGDLDALDALLDERHPASVLHRTDLVVRAERLGWIAGTPRPSST
ncbi:class I SAM-dependent methyltransferase [Dactylosporangium sp. NPDC051485]|uniref:class I SAM-dependent methyltransferase n=1 Tax=Dactylosporangium sp. NPDC051485 TaxID=3154846 RepID=UPI0034160378